MPKISRVYSLRGEDDTNSSSLKFNIHCLNFFNVLGEEPISCYFPTFATTVFD